MPAYPTLSLPFWNGFSELSVAVLRCYTSESRRARPRDGTGRPSILPRGGATQHGSRWYNTEHRHSGIGLLTPQQVHLGRAPEVIEHRRNVLAAAYDARPDRFVAGPPKAAEPPAEVWINRALPVTAADGQEPGHGGEEDSLN